MIKDILEYEKRLISDREILLELTEKCQSENDEMIQDKLKFFKTELMHMNHQYEILKSQMQPQQTMEMQSRQTEPIQPQQSVQMQPQQTIQMQPQWIEPEQKKSVSLEKTVGSSLMGILASGLIFISVILFATLVLPYLGDIFKLCGCYLLSFGLIGIALYKLQKNANHTFFLALAGCGAGALYITLLLTNLYFKYIGDISLFVLIALWVALVCYLSRAKNNVFHIIGQLGITISIILGGILCIAEGEVIKFVSLTIFYVVSFGALYATHWHKDVNQNKTANIFGGINLIVLYVFSLFIVDECSVYYIFAILLILAHVILLFLGNWENSVISYGIFTSVYGMLLVLFVRRFIENSVGEAVVIYMIAMAVLLSVEFKKKTYKEGKIFCQIAMLIMAWYGLHFDAAVCEHGYIWLLVLPVIVIGFFRRNAVCRYAALIFAYGYLFKSVSVPEQFVMGGVALAVCYTLLIWKKEEYTFAFKIGLHLLGVVFFLTAGEKLLREWMDFEAAGAITFILLSVYNIAMAKSCFAKNLKTKESENTGCYQVLNLVMMLYGLVLIHKTTVVHIPVILVTIALFLMNSKNLLEKYQKLYVGIYVGFKLTVLMVVILSSFDAVNYVISSTCILLAIISIVIGFVKQYKSLRIYGLILSMISVFKLVMVDIHYDNLLGNAISFFVSGVLCFVISLIYNSIDKKVEEKE